jgi:hypothetical protein
LRFIKPLVEQKSASAYQIQAYASLLVSTPFKELQDYPAALRYAKTVVSMTRESDPSALDVLARAYDRNGDAARAVETERKALALLPATAPGAKPSELHTAIETGLQTFQSHLVRQK